MRSADAVDRFGRTERGLGGGFAVPRCQTDSGNRFIQMYPTRRMFLAETNFFHKNTIAVQLTPSFAFMVVYSNWSRRY